MSAKPKILITRRWPQACEARLQTRFELEFNVDNPPMSVASLREAMDHFDAILPTVTDPMGQGTFPDTPPRCRFIGNFGVGFNHIDLDSAKRLGITVSNTPDVLTDCTADIAMMLLLMTARRASEGEKMIREGQWTGWHPTQLLGTRVSGKTLGLIGFGRIAKAIAQRAHFGFGMKIRVSARRKVPDVDLKPFGALESKSLEDLLESSDFVSLNCPGSPENRHLIDRARIERMRPNAILINTARGDVVDTQALIDALEQGKIRGAGLDVYEGEPHIHPGLLKAPNLTLLPHLGSATEETRTAMGMRAIDNLEDFFAGVKVRDQIC